MSQNYTIGIDIGGTKMAAVLFDGEKVLADFVLATPKDSLEHFLIMIKALVEPLEDYAKKNKIKISHIGMGIAGAFNKEKNKIFFSPNIKIIENINLKKHFKKILNYEIILDNDVNCFLLAEKKIGIAKKYKNIYGIIIGTGIGGAWYFDKKIYTGINGGAGEPGHMLINFENNIDLENAYQKLCQNNPQNLAKEAYLGDDLAQKTFDELGDYFGKAFANIINIIDPEAIVIGGGAIKSSDLFFNTIKKTMKKYIVSDESRKNIKLLKGKIEKNAGAIGAALLIN